MVGSAVGGYVDPDVIKGQRLNDAQQQTTAEGAPRAIVYGTVVVAGNVIHAGPLVEHKDRERTGKGGPVQESYTYTRTYAIRVCEGPIGNISRIWRDDKLVYDTRDPAQWPDVADDINAMNGETARFLSRVTIYKGDEDQLPDASLESLPEANGGGVGNVNAYRGSCYVVFTDDDLTDRQGAIPQYRFEVSCCGDQSSVTAIIPWVHATTGSTQNIFSGAIYGLTAIVGGQNNNLRRTVDGGRSWQEVPYTDATGWDPTHEIWGIWHTFDPLYPQGIWWMAKHDRLAISVDGGSNFADYLELAHEIHGQVYQAGGTFYAGVSGAAHTTVFQPMVGSGSDIDLGGAYGDVTCIGDFHGGLAGTQAGYIVNFAGTVLHHESGSRPILQMAQNDSGSISVAVVAGAGWLRSVDGGSSWTPITTASVGGVVFARGNFYFNGPNGIYISSDAITLTQVDDFFAPATDSGIMLTDGTSLIAAAEDTKVAVLPTAYTIPDVSGWYIDQNGDVVGYTTLSTDRCTADLSEIVTDLCERVGITSAQIDVSALVDVPVRGFTIGHPMPAADALRSLQQAYFFDFPEWGNWPDTTTKLRAVLRGGETAFTITDDNLVESSDDEDVRAQVVEFPRKINLVTSDVESDYNPTKQTFERRTHNIKAVGEATLELPLSTLRDEAAQMVDIMGRIAWEEAQGSTQFILPEDFSRLTPSDCFDKGGKRWRAESCSYGDGTVQVQAKRDRASAYSSNATAAPIQRPTVPPPTLRGPTVFAAMNLPSLRTQDNTPGVYIAVCGLLPGWIGCDLQLSEDGGETYRTVRTITNESTMGSLTANCDSGATDLISATALHNHEYDSASAAQLAARANAFAVITGTTAEVGQFGTAEETDAGVYDLSDLSRGQLGTTAAKHYTGDRFVLLDSNVAFLPLDASLAGKTVYFRPVSRGTAAANNQTYPFVFAPLFTSAPAVAFLTTKAGAVITTDAGEFIQVA